MASTLHLQIESVFRRCFLSSYCTVLKGGAEEPLYRPADESLMHNTIFYRHDYAASALHEVAHWCIAGQQRRQQLDYGYWYSPDGRNQAQQSAFEKVEVLPQAIEYAFSLAANLPFRVSVDNLNCDLSEQEQQQQARAFASKVYAKHEHLSKAGFPVRAQRFIDALEKHFKTTSVLASEKPTPAILSDALQ